MKRTELTRRTPLRVSVKPAKRQRDTGPTRKVRGLVAERDKGRCQLCQHPTDHLHHRRARRMGGSSDPTTNLPANLLSVCADCHQQIELNRSDSLDAGLLLHAGEEPERVPLLTYLGSVWLRNDGTVSLEPPQEEQP